MICGGVRNVYVCSVRVFCVQVNGMLSYANTEKQGFILDKIKQRSKHTAEWAVCGICTRLSVRRYLGFPCWETQSPASVGLASGF